MDHVPTPPPQSIPSGLFAPQMLFARMEEHEMLRDAPDEIPEISSLGGSAAPPAEPYPDPPAALVETVIPLPDDVYRTPLADNQMPTVPPFVIPSMVSPEDSVTEEWKSPSSTELVDNPIEFQPRPATADDYLTAVRNNILTVYKGTIKNPVLGQPEGYVDMQGYIVEVENGSPTSLGEATYYTAVAAVALAAGNYSPDDWEKEHCNTALEGFLRVLTEKSWGNKDSAGNEHPIRHPDWLEYWDINGETRHRARPLNRDSFAQIVAAGYYSYHCPHSSEAVRDLARRLIGRWVRYLPPRGYRTHSNYITHFDEFDKKSGNFVNLFASADRKGTISALGKDTFQLAPHELCALRRCAISMGIDAAGIEPLVGFTASLLRQYGGQLADDIAKAASRVLRSILHEFRGVAKGSFHVIPGWDDSEVTFKLHIGIPVILHDTICNAFENVVREYVGTIVRDPDTIALGADEFILRAANVVIAELPHQLQVLPLGTIFQDIIKQIVPIFDYTVYEDLISFFLALIFATTSKDDSSLVGYFVWNFIVEFETVPAITHLLIEPCRLYFSLVKQAKITNGHWAWLCGYDHIVDRQLDAFEAHPNGFSSYAYVSTKYDEWLVKSALSEASLSDHETKFSSRIDYLSLHSLKEKGLPPFAKVSLSLLNAAIADYIDGLVSAAKTAVAAVGEFVEQVTDATGKVIEKTTRTIGEVTYKVLDGTEEISRVVLFADGRAEQIISKAGEGVYQSIARYSRRSLGGIPVLGDLVEFQFSTTDQICRIWKWADGHVLSEWKRFEWELLDGTVFHLGKLLANQIRYPDKLEQWIYATSGALLAHTVWRASTDLGAAVWEDCIEGLLRDPSGVLVKWFFEGQGVVKQVQKWGKSLENGAADANAVRESTGELVSTVFLPGSIFLHSRTWINSVFTPTSLLGQAPALVLLQSRDTVTAIIEEWKFVGGQITQYGKWENGTVNGKASAEDLILLVVAGPTGVAVHHWKDGVHQASKLLDKTGKVISDAVEAVRKVFHIHW
ncbi:hypothetical protein CI109_106315 [Kwoniella shandongensis]|uniref:Uncharacterized protein n=1 Tax=Kwoniella shandongensis TaxID=1734106 RepID=A0A5M6BR40_9TREE|nr:uncharacterized protein CI109_007069 [Kwoniella shandongensis]KAA5524581.1 hypothetical protein CI109_007069 [Kwoniella shandongensis]